MLPNDLAARLEAKADELADIAYNRMQKSEEANAVFNLANDYRQAAYALYDATDSGVERTAPSFGSIDSLIGGA